MILSFLCRRWLSKRIDGSTSGKREIQRVGVEIHRGKGEYNGLEQKYIGEKGNTSG